MNTDKPKLIMTSIEIAQIKRNGERAWLYDEAMRRTDRAKLFLADAFHAGGINATQNLQAAIELIQQAEVLLEQRDDLPPIQ